MRKYSRSFVSSLFLGALGLSFALWGIADVFRGTVSDTVATIGNVQISEGAFRQEYQTTLKQEGARLGHPVTPDEARAMGLGPTALQQMLDRMALDNQVSKLGLSVSPEAAAARVQSMRVFAGPLGTFDKTRFLSVIQQYGYTEQGFLDRMRADMMQEQLMAPVSIGMHVPSDYAIAFMLANDERRAVEYLVLSPGSLAPIATPSDATLTAYLKAHADKFSTPEYRDVSFAYLGPEDMASKVTVTPDQIKQEYQAHISTYVVQERRDVEQISFNSEADARAAKAKLKGGESFAQLAAERGMKPSDLSIGSVVAADLDADRSKAAFTLALDGVSDPVKGPFSWYLLHVTKITPGSSTTLEQATPAIRKDLANQLAMNDLVDVSNKFQDALAGGDDIAQAAQKTGMHFAHVAAIDAQGLGPDGKPTTAPNNDEFRAQIFKAEVGEPGDPFQIKDGHLFALKINGVTPPKVRSLDSVRALALSGWTAEQRAAQMRTKAQDLAAAANKTRSLSSAATALHLTVEKSPALTRDTANDTFSASLIQSIFQAGPDTVVTGPLGKGDGIVLAHVIGIQHPPITNRRDFLAVDQALAHNIAGDVVQSVADSAKARQGTTVDQKLLDQAIGGEGS